tara:strand:- start:519 stop:788 length:270 start_codon:yes stop_codon:yes gene_type:complete
MSRYDTVGKLKYNKIIRFGTSYLPVRENLNSDILLIAVRGDRCDLISEQYYGTTDYWWYIASVNNLTANNIEAGTQLRIPISVEQAILK